MLRHRREFVATFSRKFKKLENKLKLPNLKRHRTWLLHNCASWLLLESSSGRFQVASWSWSWWAGGTSSSKSDRNHSCDLLGVLPVTRRRSRRRVVYQLIMIRIVSDSGSESKVDDDDEWSWWKKRGRGPGGGSPWMRPPRSSLGLGSDSEEIRLRCRGPWRLRRKKNRRVSPLSWNFRRFVLKASILS